MITLSELDKAYCSIDGTINLCQTTPELIKTRGLIKKFGEIYLKFMKEQEFNHNKAADRYLPALQMAFRLRAAQIKVIEDGRA